MMVFEAKTNEPIPLGTQGDNLLRQISFDVSGWIAQFGDSGTFTIVHQRPMDSLPYPVTIRRDGDKVLWDVTAYDTEQPASYGRAELRYYRGDALEDLLKSQVYQTSVTTSFQGAYPSYPVDTRQKFVDRLVWLAARGEWAKAQAELAQSRAEDARQGAELAQRKAETAQEEAQSAQTKAETAQAASEAARDLSRQWAEGEPGPEGAWSGKQWAARAQEYAEGSDTITGARDYRDEAEAYRNQAQAWAEGDPGEGHASAMAWNIAAYANAEAARTASLNLGRLFFFLGDGQRGQQGVLYIANPQTLGTTKFRLDFVSGQLGVNYYYG